MHKLRLDKYKENKELPNEINKLTALLNKTRFNGTWKLCAPFCGSFAQFGTWKLCASFVGLLHSLGLGNYVHLFVDLLHSLMGMSFLRLFVVLARE